MKRPIQHFQFTVNLAWEEGEELRIALNTAADLLDAKSQSKRESAQVELLDRVRERLVAAMEGASA